MNRKRGLLFSIVVLVLVGLGMKSTHWMQEQEELKPEPPRSQFQVVQDLVMKGETMLAIFEKHGLDISELFAMRDVAADVHPLRAIHAGQPYRLTLDSESRVNSFVYWINRDSYLQIKRVSTGGFHAERGELAYDKKLMTLSGAIADNLVSSVGEDREHLLLALNLSDIFAWDIDFTTDLRKGDTFKVITEGYFYNGRFRKYGNIVAAEFTNNGELFKAYRFEHDGKIAYYDEDGNARKKAFLKAPLNFRRISSHYSKGRFHPVLKIWRPHHGVDYAAATGTPVCTVGDGTVVQAGWCGGYGKMVVVRHPNGWHTRYGHLSRIAKDVKKGKRLEQGQIIGNVGSTGIATGPHLHYEVRIGDKSVNPLTLKFPKGWPVPRKEFPAFCSVRDKMNTHLSATGICEIPTPSGQTTIKTVMDSDERDGISRTALLGSENKNNM
ncbi:MAG: peptidoglycan DD-metalloendopeptidase family protein [Syntrophales bacterium]